MGSSILLFLGAGCASWEPTDILLLRARGLVRFYRRYSSLRNRYSPSAKSRKGERGGDSKTQEVVLRRIPTFAPIEETATVLGRNTLSSGIPNTQGKGLLAALAAYPIFSPLVGHLHAADLMNLGLASRAARHALWANLGRDPAGLEHNGRHVECEACGDQICLVCRHFLPSTF